MTVVRIGIATIEWSDADQWLITTYPDGTSVPAAPNHDTHSIELAHRLGYDGDTWQMSRDHDTFHSYLAVRYDGLEYSPVMWHLAHPHFCPRWWHDDLQIAREEWRVLNAQEVLDKRAPRPWVTAAASTGGVGWCAGQRAVCATPVPESEPLYERGQNL